MTKDLGVWTAEDSALVLIDYQKEMFEVIRSETNTDLVELHVRLLAKTAKAFGMPIVLSTVGVEYGFNGPTLPSILSELDGIEPIDRSPRLGNAARRAGPRRHQLVLQRSPEAHRPGGRGGGGEARRCSRAGPLTGRLRKQGPRRHGRDSHPHRVRRLRIGVVLVRRRPNTQHAV